MKQIITGINNLVLTLHVCYFEAEEGNDGNVE